MAYKCFKFTIISLLIIFLVLYISQSTGYYEFEQHRRVALTESKIKQFEQDIKEGKNIDVSHYLDDVYRNYNNKVSTSGLKFSKNIADSFNKVMGGIFKIIEKLFIS
ncbi:MAG: hypothetical protein ACOXZS_00465 [Bacilli bacterium]|jgi:hypothetical protein